MTKTLQPSHVLLCSIQIKDSIVMEDIMNTIEVAQLNPIHLMEEGLERLKNILLDPGKLKIEIPGSPEAVLENQPYFIGAVLGNQIASPVKWVMKEEADFEVLKDYLTQGLFLFKKVSEGYVILATQDNIEEMKIVRDMVGYWYDLVAEYMNKAIQEVTPWYTKPSIVPFSCFIDPTEFTKLPDGSMMNNEDFLSEVMEDLLDELINQVISFVRKDTSALTLAQANGRGVQIARFANALALKYMVELENQREIAKQADQ